MWQELESGAQPVKMVSVDGLFLVRIVLDLGTACWVQYKWDTFDNSISIRSWTEQNPELVLTDTITLIDSGTALRRCWKIDGLELNIYYLRVAE